MEAMPYAGLEPLITAVKKWFEKKKKSKFGSIAQPQTRSHKGL